MASPRPNYIDLSSNRPFDPSQARNSPTRDLPSPRSGEIPPALSPLDAFALQGRILAQQFQQNNDEGRRLSRLPPLSSNHELARPRQNYFNSLPDSAVVEKGCDVADLQDDSQNRGFDQENAPPASRHKSYYPSIQTFDDASSIHSQDSTMSSSTMIMAQHIPDVIPEKQSVPESDHYLDRTRLTSSAILKEKSPPNHGRSSNQLVIPMTRYLQAENKSVNTDSMRSTSPFRSTPPRLPGIRSLQKQPSIKPVRTDAVQDWDSISLLSEQHGQRERKMSANSDLSRPRSPFSPVFAPPRSPSTLSEFSGGGQLIGRSSVNFSRPISRTGKVSTELSRASHDFARQTSTDSPQLRPSMDTVSISDSVYSRVLQSSNSHDEVLRRAADSDPNISTSQLSNPDPAPSYIYAKYSLPRGQILLPDVASQADKSGKTHRFEWDQPFEGTNVTRLRADGSQQIIPEDVGKHNSKDDQTPESRLNTLDSSHNELNICPPTRTRSADESSPIGRSSNAHKSNPSFPPSANASQPCDQYSIVKPSTSHGTRPPRPGFSSPMYNFTTEDHLAKGIECHEQGELQKSTYHLRLAAREGSVTAMLLYALACRHGWGMRANQAEGVEWLRKAVDSAGLEVASDEATIALERSSQSGQARREQISAEGLGIPATSAIERKSHKAQLALSIYELGMSYMHGWGITEDKSLGLRCFEIASGWGDPDALAEAGFCYAKGVGCKKDLYRAADYYRRAEVNGMSMAGNSWIYKDKYMPKRSLEERRTRTDEKERAKETDNKSRDKSRTRTIFGGRKKSVAE